MDRPSDRPLTVEEAKNRLRSVTEETLPSGYVKRHPYAILGLALAAGFLIGRSPVTRFLVTRTLLRGL